MFTNYRKAIDAYDDMLDDVYSVDPIAYRVGFFDYLP
jgi:hypothetical protein